MLFDNWMSKHLKNREEIKEKEDYKKAMKAKAKREAMNQKRKSEESKQPQRGK